MWTLDDIETAACFFCAAFDGANAEAHIRDRTQAKALCVDYDQDALDRMSALYPADRFEFVCADAFETLDSLQGQVFDLVTVDPFTNMMPECADRLHEWLWISNRLVLGLPPEMTEWAIDNGASHVMPRSRMAVWGVWSLT